MTRPDLRPILLLALLGCGAQYAGDAEAPMSEAENADWAEDDGIMESKKKDRGGAARQAVAKSAPAPASVAPPPAPGFGGLAEEEMDEDAPMEPSPDDGRAEGGEDDGEAARTRAWFPETFLFEPLVQTDAQGRASVDFVVPDRLTTWRVLGLAHARSGQQAGAVAEVLGTMPAYVDPVVPAFLVAGDEVALPIQVVNTTSEPLRAPLRVQAQGAGVRSMGGSVSVAARSSQVQTVGLSTPQAGIVSLKATLGTIDEVVREIPVHPDGRLVEQTRGGTLAAPRELRLTGSADLDPSSARVRLVVFPGALAVLKSELTRAQARGGAAGDAYALLLAGRAPGLLAALGAPMPAHPGAGDGVVEAEALRTLELVAGQRIIRHARAPEAGTAALMVEATLAHPDNPIMARLGDRLLQQLAADQRPDGTFGGSADGRWTLQRLLVATADATRAAQAGAAAAELAEDAGTGDRRRRAATSISTRAGGAFERYAGQVGDGYTAAAVLASGAVQGPAVDRLRGLVRDAVQQDSDGGRRLIVEEGVVRADGRTPSHIEATALAALALADDPAANAWHADLGASLLGAYRPGTGWGDGAANLVCLQAVLALFDAPLPAEVQVRLTRDGQPLAERALRADRMRDLLVIDVPAGDARGAHRYGVVAEPSVPGLGFSLALQTWVPWEASTADRGLELDVSVPETARVGKKATITLAAAAPAGMALHIEQGLPAGVQLDAPSLDALVAAGAISAWHGEDGKVALDVPPLAAGQTFAASFQVVPTLAGSLSGGVSQLAPVSDASLAYVVPPQQWEIR